MARPAWYYQQNVGGLANMMWAAERARVDQMIFSSSSAAVYGCPSVDAVNEDVECHPHPYGETKLIGEWMMADSERAWGSALGRAALLQRGGRQAGTNLGDMATLNLIPMVMERLAKGEAPKILAPTTLTPDGTCVRDYIHVRIWRRRTLPP